MFRRKEDTIAPDASYPADLGKLGFFVNILGQVRMIDAPEKPFVFHSTNIERHNEVRDEALHACTRSEVFKRLFKLGIKQLYFPQLTPTKPCGPHIPILAPSLDILKTRKRIVVIVNDALQDLGILAYRQIQRDLGINGGSVVNFTKEMIQRSVLADADHEHSTETHSDIFNDGVGVRHDDEIPGLIVLNTGQLLYSHKYNRAMTTKSWYALPRKSIAHDHIRIHHQENYVDGHHNPVEHVKACFDQLLCNADRVAPDAEMYIIAIEGGSNTVLEAFGDDFEKYGTRITAMAVVHTLIDNSEIAHPSLKAFLHQRTRQWKYTDLSSDPTQCIALPADYSFDPADSAAPKESSGVRWNEDAGSFLKATTTLYRLPPSATLSTNGDKTANEANLDTSYEWGSGSVPCPTFAGGKEPTGESVFTEPAVQRAILSFFEEVSQDPENYCNPAFATIVEVPHPTADGPFAPTANPTLLETTDVHDVSHMMTTEQFELEQARVKLADMRVALDACPGDVDALTKGRAKLVEKVKKQEVAIEELQVRALGSPTFDVGGGEGEGEVTCKDWSPEVNGPKVPFAGTMVDSELLKAAGLDDEAVKEE